MHPPFTTSDAFRKRPQASCLVALYRLSRLRILVIAELLNVRLNSKLGPLPLPKLRVTEGKTCRIQIIVREHLNLGISMELGA